MTDEQIIKALERCFTRGFDESTCYECPFYTATAKCAEDLRDSVLNLISRQNNLIEQLGNDVNRKYNLLCKMEEILRNLKSEAIKEFAEKLTDKISVYSKYVDVDGIVILNRIFRMIEDVEKEMTEVQE